MPAVEGKRKPRPARRRGRRILVALLLALGLIAGAMVLVRARLDAWTRDALQGRLAEALGAEIRLESLELDLWHLQARFAAVDARSEREGAGRLRVTVPEGSLRMPWGALLGLRGRRLHLAEVILREPRVETDRQLFERLRGRRRKGRPLDLRIDRLEVHGGQWLLEDQTVPLDFELSGLEVEGSPSPDGSALSGTVRLGMQVLREPLAEPLALAIDGHFRWLGREVSLMGVSARGSGLDVELDGRVQWGAGVAIDGLGRASADFDLLEPLLRESFPAIAGRASGPLTVSYAGKGTLRVRGDLVAVDGRFGRIRAQEVRATTVYTPGRLELRGLTARAFGGALRGEVGVGLRAPPTFDTALTAEGVEVAELLEWLRVPLPLAGKGSGSVQLAGKAKEPGSWQGDGTFRVLAPEAESPEIGVQGDGGFRLEGGTVSVDLPRVDAGSSSFSLALKHRLGGGRGAGELSLDGATGDAAATQADLLRILESLGVDPPAAVRIPLSGHGTLRGEVAYGDPMAIGLSLALDTGAYGPQPFDRLELGLGLVGDELSIRDLELTDGPHRLAGSARISTRDLLPRQIDLRAVSLDSRPVLELLGLATDLSGQVSGELLAEPGPTGLVGNGRILVTQANAFGEPIDVAAARIEVVGGRFEFQDLDLRSSAIDARGTLVWDPERRESSATIDEATLRIAELAMLREFEARAGGSLKLSGAVALNSAGVFGTLDLLGFELSVNEIPLGDLAGRVEFTGEAADVVLRGPGGNEWKMQGTVGLSPDLPVRGEFQLDGLTVELLEGHRPPLWARLSGAVEFFGAARRPRELRIEGALDEALLRLGAHSLEPDAPVPVRLDAGRLTVGPLHLGGSGSELDAEMQLELQDGRIRAEGNGVLDLGLISAALPEVRAAGRVPLELEIGGTLDAPEYSGTIRVERGRLRWLAFPETLEQLELSATIDRGNLEIQRLRGLLGGGELAAHGTARLAGSGPEDLELFIDGRQVRLVWPEGYEGVYSGALTLRNEAGGFVLGGEVLALSGLYDQPFELGGLFGAASREYTATENKELARDLLLDLDLRADGGIWVRNDLAEVESSANLHVGGSLDRPEVTGRIWMLEGGKIRFRNVEYRIVRGSLDFVDLERITPYMAVTAETDVAEHEVTLRVEGTLDQFDYQLSSNPSLSQQDIIVLLTTGRTLQELTASGRGADYTGDLATNYFAGALTDPFEKQLQQLLKLERLQINPFLVDGDSDPTTRVTLGKEVTDDVMVILSRDLGASKRQLYQVEWQATRRLQLTVQDDTVTGIGGELRYSNRYWWKKRLEQPEAAMPVESRSAVQRPVADPFEESGSTISRIHFEGVTEEEQERLRRRIPLQEGEEFRRSKVFAASQSIRRLYVREGRIRARVETEIESAPDGEPQTEVVFRVTPGEAVVVRISGVKEKQQRKLREQLEELWSRSLFSRDLYSDSKNFIREYFQERGFYTVDVQHTEYEDEGRLEVRFQVDTGKPIRVRTVALSGVSGLEEQRILKQMLTRPSSLFSRRSLIPQVLREDLLAIRNLYRDNGMLQVRVDAPRIRLSSSADSADLHLTIHEGPEFHLSAVEFPADLPFDQSEMASWTGLEVGETFSRVRLLQAEGDLRAEIDARGYPDARVRGRSEVGGTEVRVWFEIDPGELKRVGEIHFVGNQVTKHKILSREMKLEPGDLLSREKLLRSQHELYKLGIFTGVQLRYRPLPGAADPSLQRLDVVVEEARPLGVRVGVGYDTEGGARASFGWTHDNMLGRDRVASIQGRVSQILKRIAFVATEPRLFARKIPALFDFSWEDRENDFYNVVRRSAALRLDHRVGPLWRGYLRYNFQKVDLFDVSDPEVVAKERLENLRLGNVGIAIFRSTRDDPLAPTRGAVFGFTGQIFAKPLLSEASFVKLEPGYTFEHTFRNRTNVATAVRLGLGLPFGSTDSIPISESFFAGGQSTIRGFGLGEVGPKSPTGTPLGGEGLFLFNQEFRFPIWRQFRGVLFYDAGNVWSKTSQIDLTDLRHVLGIGARMETPIGPLRIEYGHKLDRLEGETPGELFFAIGAAF